MRLTPLLWLLLPTQALAADVLFVGEAAADVQSAVLDAEGGAVIDADDLLPGDAAWGESDEAALRGLEAALGDARAYETRLDGELVIMQELAGPLGRVTALRSAEDRAIVFGALAYQGFAIDRFFGDELAEDERATDFRVEIDQQLLPSAWARGIALEPEREISPYEVADAPSRVRYESLRTHVTTALPGLLAPVMADGVDLVVDGRKTEIGASGNVKVTPGRHLVHAEKDGRILQRWTVDLAPAARQDLALTVDPSALDAWLEGLPQTSPPAFVATAIAERGGLLIVDSSAGRAYRVDGAGVVTEEAIPSPVSDTEARDTTGGLSFGAALGAGWLGSPDFYFQDPVSQEASFGTVNAMSLGLGLDLMFDVGALRAGAAADVMLPLGAAHTASYADKSLGPRPTPLLAVGLRQAQVAAGYLFPHHVALGGRLTLPLGTSGLELRGTGLAGLPPKRSRDDGSTWEGHVLGTAWIGVGWRAGG